MPRAPGLRPLLRRALADRDVEEALDHYLAKTTRAAEGLVAALEQAYRHVSHMPDSGSPRWAHGLNLPGLRAWPLKRYPYLVFYRAQPAQVEVWRVLNTRRDIPAWLGEEDAAGQAPPT